MRFSETGFIALSFGQLSPKNFLSRGKVGVKNDMLLFSIFLN